MSDFDDFSFSGFTMSDTGSDAFLGKAPEPIDLRVASPQVPNTIRVASIRDLAGFRRVAQDRLVRPSENDLWKLRQSDDGAWVVERLFDEDGNPLKAG